MDWWRKQSNLVKLLIVVLVAIFLATVIQVIGVSGEKQQGDSNTASAHVRSHKKQKKKFVHYVKKQHSKRIAVPSKLVAERGWNCRRTWTRRVAKAAVGWTLYWHEQVASWCWNGDRLSNVKFRTDWGKPSWTHWHVSNILPNASGGNKHYRYRRSKLEWEFCAFWVCVHSYTFVAQTVRDDGTIGSDTGKITSQ